MKKKINSEAEILLSIHVCSNRPKQILKFLDALESTSKDKTCFEVLINIDVDDFKMTKLLTSEQKRRPFALRFVNKFKGGFYNSHEGYNELLNIMNKNAYFSVLLSDEMIFQTQDWDSALQKYKNYYDDNIFRIKCSRFKYRNYIDPWECGFAPDNITFITTRWLLICGSWSPCFSSDAFQQYISYYLFTSDQFKKSQFYRDISEPFLKFSGDIAAVNQSEDLKIKRISEGIVAWFKLNSHEMQENAKLKAMLLKSYICKESFKARNLLIRVDKRKKLVLLCDNAKIISTFSYKIYKMKILFINLKRKLFYLNYCGGGWDGIESHDILFNILYYLEHRYKVVGLVGKYNNYCLPLKKKIKKIFGR